MNPDYYVVFDALAHVKRHHLDRLNTYDHDFVVDVLYRISQGRDLTPRQIDHVARIWNRVKTWEQHTSDQER
jgi:hypothetical protein